MELLLAIIFGAGCFAIPLFLYKACKLFVSIQLKKAELEICEKYIDAIYNPDGNNSERDKK